MSHFAYVPNIVEGKGIVEEVIRIDQETLNTGHWGNPSDWIQTSYNTIGNQHMQGGMALRGNYAGIDDIYDQTNDKFYKPQPFASWSLNQDKWIWEAPTPMPENENLYEWDEATTSWIEVVPAPPPVDAP